MFHIMHRCSVKFNVLNTRQGFGFSHKEFRGWYNPLLTVVWRAPLHPCRGPVESDKLLTVSLARHTNIHNGRCMHGGRQSLCVFPSDTCGNVSRFISHLASTGTSETLYTESVNNATFYHMVKGTGGIFITVPDTFTGIWSCCIFTLLALSNLKF